MPVFLLASLAAGLGADSRTGMKMCGTLAKPEVIMLANIFDAVNMLTYSLSGAEGEPPESAAEKYFENYEQKEQKVETFATGEDFERRRKELLERHGK